MSGAKEMKDPMQGIQKELEEKSDDTGTGSSNPPDQNPGNASESRKELEEKSDDTGTGSSLTTSQDELDKARNTLKEKENELTLANKRLTESQDDLHKATTALGEKDKELKSATESLTTSQDELDKARNALKKKENELTLANKRLTTSQDDLKKARLALEKTTKELDSFKNRMAQHVAPSVKTGDTESMNDPVSKTRLTEMYNSLKLEKWTDMKDLLKSNKTSPEFTRALVQKTFKDAAEEMQRKKQQIEETFGSAESSSGQENQKVEAYRKLAVQNLQLALYHSNKDLLKSPFPKYEGEKAEDAMVNLRRLTSECHWLGCLIALNHPPLQPDWESQHYEKNSWDIFPHGLKESDK